MKKTLVRLLSALLAALLLCGTVSFAASAVANFEFNPKTYAMTYRRTLQIKYTGTAPVRWEIIGAAAKNTGITVSPTGLVTSAKCRAVRTDTFFVVAYDANGEVERCVVKVKPNFWQWQLIIFIFGWAWY